jgi:type IV fimbrial biogenesis protein FimT
MTSRRNCHPRRLAGFSLIELMTVVVVLGIFAAMALPGFSYLSRSTRIKGAATTLYLALIKTRSEAVKRNASVTIRATGTGGDWQSGWQIVDAANNVLVAQEALKGGCTATLTTSYLAAAGTDLANSNAAITSVTFQSSGRVLTARPQFAISYGQRSSDKTTSLARCLTVQTNGTPQLTSSACP